MTITIRPLHLAILVAFVAGILVASGLVFALNDGSDGSSPAQRPASANVSLQPTFTPEPQPTATATQAAPPATPTQTPEPSAPVVRTCEEIRADPDYRSPEEREFFLANCTNPAPNAAAPSSPQQPAPVLPPQTTGATEEEAAYRRRAEGLMVSTAARFVQYYGQPSQGAVYDFLELGSIAGGWANSMAQFEPVPPRFSQAHDQLRAALYDFSDWCQLATTLETEEDWAVFLDGVLVFGSALGAAWDDYELVVGIALPDPPR